VQSDDTLCIAYSGGPDSTALISLLARLRTLTEFSGLQLTAAYIDHGLRSRPERTHELALVQSVCARLNIPLYLKFFPPHYLSHHDRNQLGTEAVAREFRYRFLYEVKQSVRARWIVLGHTRDDHIETVLMRCFQGSGPEGLQGIAESSTDLWRPLLSLSKAQLQEYLRENRLASSTDSTNTDAVYTRNFVRQSLLPRIREAFPGVDGSLLHMAEKMQSVEAVLEDYERNFDKGIDFIESADGTAAYDYSQFMSLLLYVRVRMVYRLYNRWYSNSPLRLPYRFVRQLCTCKIDAEQGCCGEGYGIRIEKRGSMLFCERAVVPNRKNSYLIVVQAGNVYIGDRWRLNFRSEPLDSTPPTSFNTLKFTAKMPCVIRTRRTGDFLYGKGGKKKVKDALREMGVSREERPEVAVLEDRRGVLALLPLHSPEKIRWSRFAKSREDADAQFEIMELKSERK